MISEGYVRSDLPQDAQHDTQSDNVNDGRLSEFRGTRSVSYVCVERFVTSRRNEKGPADAGPFM
jgi:hypothetical protein